MSTYTITNVSQLTTIKNIYIYSASISNNILVLGSGTAANVVYTYILSSDGCTWKYLNQITGPSGSSGFGGLVAISGNILVINENTGISSIVYTCILNNNIWGSLYKFTSPIGGVNSFGNLFDISGNTVVINDYNSFFNASGNVYTLNFNGTTWDNLIPISTASYSINNYNSGFGVDISISNDIIVIGTKIKNIYIAKFINGYWNIVTFLNNNKSNFGSIVDILENNIIVYDNNSNNHSINIYSLDDNNNFITINSFIIFNSTTNILLDIQLSKTRILVLTNSNQVYTLILNNNNWGELTTLYTTGNTTYNNNLFGFSPTIQSNFISLSNNNILVGYYNYSLSKCIIFIQNYNNCYSLLNGYGNSCALTNNSIIVSNNKLYDKYTYNGLSWLKQ